jgi:hypothetical protein
VYESEELIKNERKKSKKGEEKSAKLSICFFSQVPCFLGRHESKIRPFSFKFKSRWLSYEYT